MTRRYLLGMLGLLPAVAGVPTVPMKSTMPQRTEEFTDYGYFKARFEQIYNPWTGKWINRVDARLKERQE